jgi:glutamate synthase (ferredoxin)
VLGATGRNFAAGMSGGEAYVFDEAGDFAGRCNPALVDLSAPETEDLETLHEMIENHAVWTKSARAAEILTNWETASKKIVKIMPRDYKRVLDSVREAEAAGLSGDEASAAAFEANVGASTRASGN